VTLALEVSTGFVGCIFFGSSGGAEGARAVGPIASASASNIATVITPGRIHGETSLAPILVDLTPSTKGRTTMEPPDEFPGVERLVKFGDGILRCNDVKAARHCLWSSGPVRSSADTQLIQNHPSTGAPILSIPKHPCRGRTHLRRPIQYTVSNPGGVLNFWCGKHPTNGR
jgi:hypothetical protein